MVNPETLISIESAPGGLDEAVAKILSFNPDLIIEGGTGSRPILRNLVRDAAYTGPYVGLDLNWEIIEEGAFTRYGNCARSDSVTPVIQEFAAKKTAFVTWNALPTILSDRISHEDRKNHDDVLPVKTIAQNTTQLYACQMHVIYKDFFGVVQPFLKYCVELGWKLFSYDQDRELMVIVMTRE